jgi:hypothetical protein
MSGAFSPWSCAWLDGERSPATSRPAATAVETLAIPVRFWLNRRVDLNRVRNPVVSAAGAVRGSVTCLAHEEGTGAGTFNRRCRPLRSETKGSLLSASADQTAPAEKKREHCRRSVPRSGDSAPSLVPDDSWSASRGDRQPICARARSARPAVPTTALPRQSSRETLEGRRASCNSTIRRDDRRAPRNARRPRNI